MPFDIHAMLADPYKNILKKRCTSSEDRYTIDTEDTSMGVRHSMSARDMQRSITKIFMTLHLSVNKEGCIHELGSVTPGALAI